MIYAIKNSLGQNTEEPGSVRTLGVRLSHLSGNEAQSGRCVHSFLYYFDVRPWFNSILLNINPNNSIHKEADYQGNKDYSRSSNGKITLNESVFL